jgi:hypothetical protein
MVWWILGLLGVLVEGEGLGRVYGVLFGLLDMVGLR